MIKSLSQDHCDDILALDSNTSKQSLLALMDKKAFYGLVFILDHKVVGFIYGWIFDDSGEVIQITVDAQHRQKGYGQALLKAFIENHAVETCWLELKQNNTAALNLYKKLGFVEDGVRKGYYQSATDDDMSMNAILMQWNKL